jgi:hypothetical protein
MGPVACHRVARIVAQFFSGLAQKPTLFQAVQHDAVGAGRKAVAVRKNEQGFGSIGQGVLWLKNSD